MDGDRPLHRCRPISTPFFPFFRSHRHQLPWCGHCSPIHSHSDQHCQVIKCNLKKNYNFSFNSAIYGDPTLGANLKFVILRMIFYEGTSLPQIVEDNATVSLENVNEWNHGIWNALPRDERHDVAVWLTRLNIGLAAKHSKLT